MAEPIKKEDIKEALTEALEPFAGAIKEDFNRVDERFNKIEATLISIVEDLKDARKERQNLGGRPFLNLRVFGFLPAYSE